MFDLDDTIRGSLAHRHLTRKGLAILLVVVALVAFAAIAYANCTYYYNSRAAWVEGYEVCAYSGGGCTECADGSTSCVTNGNGKCGPFQDTP